MSQDTKSSFLNWYEPIHDRFVMYCRSKSFGTMDVEDLVQEAVLATLESFDKIRQPEKLLAYMIGTANNIVRNKKRRLKFKATWDERLINDIEAKAPSPEVATDIHFLLKAMNRLSSNEKEAIELFEISGFSIREISQIQQCSEAAVKTRLSRARKKLRTLLNATHKKPSLSTSLTAFVNILL